MRRVFCIRLRALLVVFLLVSSLAGCDDSGGNSTADTGADQGDASDTRNEDAPGDVGTDEGADTSTDVGADSTAEDTRVPDDVSDDGADDATDAPDGDDTGQTMDAGDTQGDVSDTTTGDASDTTGDATMHVCTFSEATPLALGEDQRGFATQGDRLYVVTDTGLRTFDASTPAAPTEIGTAVDGVTHVVSDPTRTDDAVYVGHSNGTVMLLDMADPSSPQVLGSLVVESTPLAADQGVVLMQHIAGVARRTYSVERVDFTDPANPALQGRIAVTSNAIISGIDGAAQSGDIVYVSSETAAGTYALEVLDYSTPSSPSELASLDQTDSGPVDVAGTDLYLALGSTLIIYDVATPSAPAELGRWVSSWFGSMLVDAPRIYFGGGPTFLILDVSNPMLPSEVDSFRHGHRGTAPMHRVGDTYYTGDADDRTILRVYDLTCP